MTRKYLNRNFISKTGMSFRIEMAAKESSPYNQRHWLLPPGRLQLRLLRSFHLLYCFQMLLGINSSGSCVIATSTGGLRLRLTGLRGVSPASPGTV